MSKEDIQIILTKVQQNSTCHQKYLKLLKKKFSETSFEYFLKNFVLCLEKVFAHKNIESPYVERILDFCAAFVSTVNTDESRISSSSDEDLSNLFLSKIIKETLKYHDLIYVQTRYHACRFLTLILQHLDGDTQLDNDICDSIQLAMLERMEDSKVNIRMQAVMALVRLQEPTNPDCLVVKAYLLSIKYDRNASVRRQVIKNIAPTATTLPVIKERVRDIDHTVRKAAFQRCADIGPTAFKIVDRHRILFSGFNETHRLVKEFFLNNLLPKWLTSYDGDFLVFLRALKLDADEKDITNTTELSKSVMEVFIKSHPITDIISALPLNSDKLIPIDTLTSEVVTYWFILINYLRNIENGEGDEYLDRIIPELTPFSNYIENMISVKSANTMAEWQCLEYQFILYNLFEMAEHYDMSDEIGRRRLQQLVMSTIQNHKFYYKLVGKLIAIAAKLVSNIDVFTNEVCQMISDIREPLVDVAPSQEQLLEKDFRLAELRVKINILLETKQESLDKEDFGKVSMVQNELAECLRQIENVNKQFESEKVKQNSKDNPETICRCLDMLIGLLQLSEVKSLSPALKTCQDEFLVQLLVHNNVEINWRVLKCLNLICLIDEGSVEKYAKVLAIPVATYHSMPNHNKDALMVSVSSISDFLRFYGASVYSQNDDTSNSTTSKSISRRKLYRKQDADDVTSMEIESMTAENLIEIILDMLDDDEEDLRHIAADAIFKLVVNEFSVDPLFISRILLKWYNPLTEKQDVRLQEKLGLMIAMYGEQVKGAREIIGKAVHPTISSIANAPRTSPLAEIDLDNVLRFLAHLTNKSTGLVHIHNTLAFSLSCQIYKKPDDCCAPYIVKMLNYLDISTKDLTAIKEMLNVAELIYEQVVDKAPKKNLLKFLEKLRGILRDDDVIQANSENNEDNVENDLNDDEGLVLNNNVTGDHMTESIEKRKRKHIPSELLGNISEGSTETDSGENDRLSVINSSSVISSSSNENETRKSQANFVSLRMPDADSQHAVRLRRSKRSVKKKRMS